MLRRLTQVARDTRDRGASAVEYGLMVAAIAAVVAGTVFALGGLVNSAFDKTCSAISDPTGQTCVDGKVGPKPPVVPPPATDTTDDGAGAGAGGGGVG